MKRLKLVIGVGLSSILSSLFFTFAVDTSKLGDTGTASFQPMLQQTTSESFESETIIGSNIFFHEIDSGTCVSHGFDNVNDIDLCHQAAKSKGYTFRKIYTLDESDPIERVSLCFIDRRWNFSSSFLDIFSAFNNKLVMARDETCKTSNASCKCTVTSPCFCTSKFFAHGKRNHIVRNSRKNDEQFSVKWALSLGGRESLLEESAFLKAAFEQSVKDYINNDILCSDNLLFKGAEFFSVEILVDNDVDGGKKKAVSGNGSCKGDLSKCKKPLKVKKKNQPIEKVHDDQKTPKVVQITNFDEVSCEIFLRSTIFDAFKEKLLTASEFNYNVDVDVLNDLEGNIDLKYDVSFEPAKGDGLDQIDDVDMDANEPIAINPVCLDSQCTTQRDVIRNIFRHFNLEFDENKHECMIQGINCNEEDLIIHIWMVKCGFDDYTIPKLFGDLPSLKGLFFGDNGLVGEIPSTLGKLKNLQMLWLENNRLTGTIPSKLGNIRPLLELNLHGNNLEGQIPSEFSKFRRLQMLNLGNNNLSGSLNFLHGFKKTMSTTPGCIMFPNPFFGFETPFNKIFHKNGLKSKSTEESVVEVQMLTELKSLSLYNNSLTGSIPTELGHSTKLSDLSLAENNLSGSLPSEFGNMIELKVLDMHQNFLNGHIPSEIGKIVQLKILNLLDNNFDGKIPPEIGRLFKLNELVFDNNDLTGPIPVELGNLENLNYLTFGNNSMSGEIPTELGNLDALKNLDIRGYTITVASGSEKSAGTIPTELGKLKSWKYVVFENNGVEGSVPSEFGDLESSEAMWLKNQKLTGSIPSDLSKLQSMSKFSIGDNALSGNIPTELGVLEGLATLDIGSNSLTGEIPVQIANISKLKFMSLGNENVTGALPSEIGELKALEFMFLAGSRLSGEIPSELGQLSDMKAFGASGGKFSGKMPSELGSLGNLASLDLANNGLSGQIPSQIAQITTLTSINLAFNSITGKIPSELGVLDDLVTLNLTGNQLSGEIPQELSKADSLQEILLCSNNISSTIPVEILSMTGLQKLELCNNAITGMINIDLSLKNSRLVSALEVIDLGSNIMTGTLPSELANYINLQILSLGNNRLNGTIPTQLGLLEALTDFNLARNALSGSLPTDIGNMSSLQSLDLNGNTFTGSIPSELGKLQSLQEIDLGENMLNSTIPMELGEIDTLEYLDISSNELTGRIPPTLENLAEDGAIILQAANTIVISYNSTFVPSVFPSLSMVPSQNPSSVPTLRPSTSPSQNPSIIPTLRPSSYPSILPSSNPSLTPSFLPTLLPSSHPSIFPSLIPSYKPSLNPTSKPSLLPTLLPSSRPSIFPSLIPSFKPSLSPSSKPSLLPSLEPSLEPSNAPSVNPSFRPSLSPSSKPSLLPTMLPSLKPSFLPSTRPTSYPSMAPTFGPFGVYPPTLGSNVYYGWSVAVSSTTMIVGATLSNGQAGVAHKFSSTGDYLGLITAPDATAVDYFGSRVACSDTHIAISAPYDDDGAVNSGSVYLFQIDGTYVTKVQSSFISSSGHFGINGLAMDENYVIASQHRYNSNTGITMVFDNSGGGKFSVQHNDPAINDYFGYDADIADGFIVVGAYMKATHGAAYIFTDTGSQVAKLLPSDPSGSAMRFGYSVGVSDNTVVVGAPYADGIVGAVYVFQTDGTFLFKIAGASDSLSGDQFGFDIDISSVQNKIIVGAPYRDANALDSGAVYTFQLDGTEIQRSYGKLSQQYFGYAVAISDTSQPAVGAYFDYSLYGYRTGGAYLVPDP